MSTQRDRLSVAIYRVYEACELVSLAARLANEHAGDIPESLQGLAELLDAAKDKLVGLSDEISTASVAEVVA